MGDNEKSLQTLEMTADCISDLGKAFFENVVTKPKDKWAQFNMQLGGKFLAPLEAGCIKHGGCYLAGSKITYVDLQFMSGMSNLKRWKPSLLDDFPKLQAVFDELLKNEKIKKSKDREDKLPLTFQYKEMIDTQIPESKNHPVIQMMQKSVP